MVKAFTRLAAVLMLCAALLGAAQYALAASDGPRQDPAPPFPAPPPR